MCIFEHGKAKARRTCCQKNRFLYHLVGDFAFVSLHASHLFVELFACYRSLVCRLYHDDAAVRTNSLFHFLGLLGVSASKTGAPPATCVGSWLQLYSAEFCLEHTRSIAKISHSCDELQCLRDVFY